MQTPKPSRAPARHPLVPCVVALAVVVLFSARATGGSGDPLLRRDFPDPFVLRDGDAYYAFATGTAGSHLQVARSKDLAAWDPLPDPLPKLPAWAAKAAGLTWAPAVLGRGDRFVLYFTAADEASGFQCIGRATATRPEGPYVDEGPGPLVCQVAGDARRCGSIDPSPFVDRDGRAYLLWKSDENADACRGAARLWSQPLAADGLSVVGEPSPLLTTDRPWELPLIEGPSMIEHGGMLHLFYSANWYDSERYAIGHATCATPDGPCTKTSTDAPLVKSAGDVLGPGGQELFTDASGSVWMAYHAWTAPRASYGDGGARSLRLSRVTFADGMPRVAVARGLSAAR